MNNLVVAEALKPIIKQYDITDPALTERIVGNFSPYLAEIEELGEELKTLTLGNENDIEAARKLSRRFSTVCSNLEKQKKADKADVLLVGRLIDGVFNTIESIARIKQKQAKDIADYFDNLEKAKLEQIAADRRKQLAAYEGLEPMGFEKMPEDIWENYMAGVKLAYEKRKADEKTKEIEAAKQKIGMDRLILASEYKMFWDRETYPFAEMTDQKFEACMVFLKKRKSDYEKQQAILVEQNKVLQKQADERAQEEKKAAQEKAALDKKLKSLDDGEKLLMWVDTFSITNYPEVSEGYKDLAKEIMRKFEAFKNWSQAVIEHQNSNI